MPICNTYSSVDNTMKEQKIHVCTPKVHSVRKCATSADTKASTETPIKGYWKDMEEKRKNDPSTKAWYIKYQTYKTINKNYKRITEDDTHKIQKLYAWKTEIKE